MTTLELIIAVAAGVLLYLGALGWLLFRNKITGLRFLGFMVGVFGLIIAVNLTLAFKAVETFPGLEVENSYVASQSFDTEMAAQKRLGWTLAHSYKDGQLRLAFTDSKGQPVRLAVLDVLVGRTTEAKDDTRPVFTDVDGVYTSTEKLQPGKWMMHVEARAEDGTLFRQRLNLFVRG